MNEAVTKGRNRERKWTHGGHKLDNLIPNKSEVDHVFYANYILQMGLLTNLQQLPIFSVSHPQVYLSQTTDPHPYKLRDLKCYSKP